MPCRSRRQPFSRCFSVSSVFVCELADCGRELERPVRAGIERLIGRDGINVERAIDVGERLHGRLRLLPADF